MHIFKLVCFLVLYGFISETFAYKRVCYYQGSLPPSTLDPFLCTHVLFAFAKVTKDSIGAESPKHMVIWKQLQAKKAVNPNLKIMLSAGGADCDIYHETLMSEELQMKFINQSISFLRRYNFDGIDIDFEELYQYEELYSFGKFIQRFRKAIDQEDTIGRPKLLISAALESNSYALGFSDWGPLKLDRLGIDLDFINLMTYDFNIYSKANPKTGYNSPLFARPDDLSHRLNTNWSAYHLKSLGVPPEKIIVGIPIYGRSYILLNASIHGIHAMASARGPAYAYFKVCKFLKNGMTSVFDQISEVPYGYQNKTWISYDDGESIHIKSKWIRDIGKFGGAMTWSVDMDDYDGKHCRNGVKFQLHKIIKETLP